MNIETYPPNSELRVTNLILPSQTHGIKIVEVISGTEDLSACDGLWTKDPQFTLGIKTADCAPIAFYSAGKYGIIHAGWRGLCDGIVEKMCNIFNPDSLHSSNSRVRTQIWVGPILPLFEIQKDDCYERIHCKFGDKFFVEKVPLNKGDAGGLYFDFKSAIASIIPTAQFDERSTYDTLELASWRRDQDQRRNITTIHHA